VYDGTEENIQEIEEFRVKHSIPKNKTWLMPAGDNRETLIDMYPKSIELCMKMGYNWTGRDHIVAWDTKRAV
jgi:7-carboxy-7-deazaguanine synthase